MVNGVYGGRQFVILRGLDPNRYDDTENVIVHAGLSSHVGSQRGLAGHEGGDNTAISKHMDSGEGSTQI